MIIFIRYSFIKEINQGMYYARDYLGTIASNTILEAGDYSFTLIMIPGILAS